MLFTLGELFDIILMCLAVGFIFSAAFPIPAKSKKKEEYDPIEAYQQKSSYFDWESIKFAMLITVPAIIFHELGHKFVALAFGSTATFHAAYFWLVIGVILRLLNFGFIFFVPAYVTHGGDVTPFASAMIALAGPGVNFLLWIGALIALRARKYSPRTTAILELTKQINLFLMIFNMIPLGFFDGAHVVDGLWQAFGG